MAAVHPARDATPRARRRLIAALLSGLAGVVIGVSVADVGAAVVRSLLVTALVTIATLVRPHRVR